MELKHRKKLGDSKHEYREGQLNDQYNSVRAQMKYNMQCNFDNSENIKSGLSAERVAPKRIAKPELSPEEKEKEACH